MSGPFLPGKLNPDARLQLFCLPYAGAGASRYFRWASLFPPDIEVRPVLLPGRESRIRETPFTDMADLVPAVAGALLAELRGRFAIFGHSMGALIAFELARHLRRESGLAPVRLFASGCRAPHVPPAGPVLHTLEPDEFAHRVRRLQDAPGDAVWNDEYMELMLPTLRADFEVCETYRYKHDDPLECPISALGGLGDGMVGEPDSEAWAAQTSAGFTLRMFPGGHLFLNECEFDVARSVIDDLSYAAAGQ